MTLTPIPTMANPLEPADDDADPSMRMPPIFLPPTRTSLGHLIETCEGVGTSLPSAVARANEDIMLSCEDASKPGRRTSEKSRFAPGGETQVR